jgi:phosphatidylcholine synthase
MTPWVAHLYTGLGAGAALAATIAVIAGDYRAAFLWLAVQIVIDATDGLLARALRVKERLPHFDGARLDDIIDYLSYAFVPVVLIVHAGLVPPTWGVWVGVVVLLASGYGFSQTAAKVQTSDHFFTGFPSYWNVVALYLFLLQMPPVANAAVLLGFSVLVFVPVRYVYPSRTVTLSGLTNSLGVAWAVLMAWIVWRLPATEGPWIALSAIFPVYYFALSFVLEWRVRTGGAGAETRKTTG